jgi:hypothetical protein
MNTTLNHQRSRNTLYQVFRKQMPLICRHLYGREKQTMEVTDKMKLNL